MLNELFMLNELLVCVITSDAFSPAMRAPWRRHAFFICTSRLFGLDPVLWCCLFMHTSMPGTTMVQPSRANVL
jgi:hypothetical protein